MFRKTAEPPLPGNTPLRSDSTGCVDVEMSIGTCDPITQARSTAGSYHHRFPLVLAFVVVFGFALAYLYLVRPGLQWPLALDTIVEAPDVAPGHSSAVPGAYGASTLKHRTSRVEQGVNRESASGTKDPPQLRRTRPGSVTQGTEPELRGYDEAQEVDSRRVSTSSATLSTRISNIRGLGLGVAQPVDDAHDTTLLAHSSNDTTSAEATAPTSNAYEVRGANGHVAQSVLSTGSIGTQPPWYIPLSLQEIGFREHVLSPHAPPHPRARRRYHRFDAIERVLAAAEELPGRTSNSHPPSPSTRSQLPTVGGARNSSLVKALAGWDLSNRVAPLAVLAVGVGGECLPGPDHDLKWIGRTFPAAILYALRGSHATKQGILSALTHTFEHAESVLVVVLYFTGHSDDHNAFKLNDGQSIDETTLFTWIGDLRRTTGKRLPVLLVFDFCRENGSAPPVSTHGLQDIYIIWACKPGERSLEVNLGDNLPYSDLLKVICLALHKIRPCPPESPKSFMGEVTNWVSRILRIHRTIICGKRKCDMPWNECCCLECFAGSLCLHLNHLPAEDYPPIQKPVGWFSGFGDDVDVNKALHAMQPVLRYVEESIQTVATEIVNNKWYLKSVPQDPSRRSSGSGEKSFRPIVASVLRGPSGALAAASSTPLPCDSSG